jgi:organic radical activating enzyme
MNRIKTLWRNIFPYASPIPAGVYSYEPAKDSEIPFRMHLRIEPDGSGVVILNAHTVLHLNSTAAEYAWHMVNKSPEDETIRSITRRYNINRQQVLNDRRELIQKLEAFLASPDLDPETFLDFGRQEPYSKKLSAPYRLDCALTYQTGDGHDENAPADRIKRELLTDEWKKILEKAWNAGIPHIVFTGGEPTLRPDLVDLITYASQLGQVTGLLTDGLRLSEKEYLHALLQSGLDHLMITLDSREDQAWESIRDILAEDIFLTVHLTLDQKNSKVISSSLTRLAAMGIKSLSLSSSDSNLAEELKNLHQIAADSGLSLEWDLPVPYSSFHPVSIEMKDHETPPQGAGIAWLYVEPDGDVLPAQGINQVLGNLVSDPWANIWKQS